MVPSLSEVEDCNISIQNRIMFSHIKSSIYQMNSRHPAKWQQSCMKGETRNLEERFTSNCCYLGSPPISQNMIHAYPSCQTQLQIGKRFVSPPRPHQGEQWSTASAPPLCGRCSVSNHPVYMPTSFVIASSCKWWHTACISRYQWPSTPHQQLAESQETKELSSSTTWWSQMKGKYTWEKSGKVNKRQHKKCTYCSCEQQGTQ